MIRSALTALALHQAGFDRSRWLIGLGTNFVFDSDFSIRVEYRGVFGSSGDRDNALQLIFQKSY